MAKRTCLYDMHLKYKGKIVDFAGFELPIQYEGIISEHEATRNNVGLFDVSHMGKFHLSGEDATSIINALITNDLGSVLDGQAIYSPMCYENGGTVDDILVYKYSDISYLLVVNAANKDKDYQWFEEHLEGSVQLMDVTDIMCQIAVQGPKALALVQSLTQKDLSGLGYYHFYNDVTLGGTQMLISRTGYTGEDGYELYFPDDMAHDIWALLMEEGAAYGIKPCGLGARDTLRFEAGMPLYGNELSEDINPIEAGLSYFVHFDKEDFIGKSALMREQDDRRRKMVGFELTDRGMVRHGGLVVDVDGNEIGHVTTGYKSPTLGVTLGIAIVPWAYSATNLWVEVRNKKLQGKIINKRFLKTYKKES